MSFELLSAVVRYALATHHLVPNEDSMGKKKTLSINPKIFTLIWFTAGGQAGVVESFFDLNDADQAAEEFVASTAEQGVEMPGDLPTTFWKNESEPHTWHNGHMTVKIEESTVNGYPEVV